jgi:sugar/nucleoside kinase (ribokinase family)
MKKVIGLGNALVDIMTQLKSDDTLHQLNFPRGSMQLVDDKTSTQIDQNTSNLKKSLSAGGSAANTINGLANLNIDTSFIGKVGDDELGRFFGDDQKKSGIQPQLLSGNAGSGRAIGLISPDSERTFATFLGAAIELSASDLHVDMFSGYDVLHIEGYLVQNHELIREAVKLAKDSGLKVSIDLASFNVVEDNRAFLNDIISEYVDIVFANEEEAKAYTQQNPKEALHTIAEQCEIAIVKLGKEGSLIKKGEEIAEVGVITANALDTTGAGDLYASGFLYGLIHGLSLKKCGQIGAILSGNVIEVIGSKMDQDRWAKIRKEVSAV